MIRITQLKLPITHTEEQLHRKIAKMLRLGNQPFTYEIRKQSLDARHKEDKKFVYTVEIKLDNESRVLKKVHDKNIMLTSEKKYHFPASGSEVLSHRPVVIGSGPAGLFCAWYLAKAGYCPLVLERGEEADKRQETVENFWKNGILDPDSNVQFGEGGAGTFSDGKLNTLVKDTYGRGKEVLSRFVEAGAPYEILYQQKPHLGTDQLVGIVQFMRHQIEEMGGEFRFRSTVTDLIIRDRKLNAVIVNEKEEIPAEPFSRKRAGEGRGTGNSTAKRENGKAAQKPSREERRRTAVKAAARERYANARPVKRGKGSARKDKQ